MIKGPIPYAIWKCGKLDVKREWGRNTPFMKQLPIRIAYQFQIWIDLIIYISPQDFISLVSLFNCSLSRLSVSFESSYEVVPADTRQWLRSWIASIATSTKLFQSAEGFIRKKMRCSIYDFWKVTHFVMCVLGFFEGKKLGRGGWIVVSCN